MDNSEDAYKLALQYVLKKIEKNMNELKDFFPFVTVNGKWELCKDEGYNRNE